jgi:hypothetical protein
MSVSRLYTGGGCTRIETNYALSRADSPTHHQSAWLPQTELGETPRASFPHRDFCLASPGTCIVEHSSNTSAA